MGRARNVYLIGRAMGSYRTQNLIKYLLDRRNPGLDVHYNSFKPQLYSENSGIKGIMNRVLTFFHVVLIRLFSLYNLAISDIVILTAMSNEKQFELKYARIFKKLIITDYYKSLYDSEVLDRKRVKPDSDHARKLMAYDRNCVEKADFSLFLNKSELNYYLGLMDIPYDPAKHMIVPLCVEQTIECELNYYADKNSRVFNVCWWGTYIPLHGLEKIIEAAKILKRDYSLDFHIYLFGTNEKKGRPYVKLIEEHEVSSVVTVDNNSTFNNGRLTDFLLQKCDLVLGNFGDSPKAKNVLVNKLIDGVAMRAPVLTGESVAPHEFFSENEISYSENTPESIAEKIYQISRMEHDDIMGQVDRAYDVFERVFSVEAYNERIDHLFNNKVLKEV